MEEGCQPDAENLIELMNDSLPHDIPHQFLELIEVMKKCSKSELDDLKDRYVQAVKVDDKTIMEKQ